MGPAARTGMGGSCLAWGRAACGGFSCLMLSEPSPCTSTQSQTSKKLWLSPGIYSLAKLGWLLWGGKAQLQHQGRAHTEVRLCSVAISQLALNILKAGGTFKCLSHPILGKHSLWNSEL